MIALVVTGITGFQLYKLLHFKGSGFDLMKNIALALYFEVIVSSLFLIEAILIFFSI